MEYLLVNNGDTAGLVRLLASLEPRAAQQAAWALRGVVHFGNEERLEVAKKAGCLDSLARLLGHSDSDVVLQAAWLLAELAECAALRRRIAEVPGMLEALSDLMACWDEEDDDGQSEQSVKTLALLARTSDVREAISTTDGCLDGLVALLYAADAANKRWAMVALARLCAGDSEAVRKRVAETDFPEAVASLLQVTDAVMVAAEEELGYCLRQHALKAVANLCACSGARERVLQSSDELLAAMSRRVFSADERIGRPALEALLHLAASRSGRVAIVQHESAVHAAAQLLSSDDVNQARKDSALRLLELLSADVPSAREWIADDHFAINYLAQQLASTSADAASIRRNKLSQQLLRNLAADGPMLCERIAEEGSHVVKALAALIERGHDADAVGTLADLAFNLQARSCKRITRAVPGCVAALRARARQSLLRSDEDEARRALLNLGIDHSEEAEGPKAKRQRRR
jgi:hypothetical protein